MENFRHLYLQRFLAYKILSGLDPLMAYTMVSNEVGSLLL